MKLPHECPGCAWLFASSGSRTMMEYYCIGGVLQYASGHLTPIELLHVHRVREGERVAKASPSLASHHAQERGRDAPAFACMTGGPNRWVAHPSRSQRQVRLRHRSSVREGEGVVVIKLLGLVRVDATHHSTGPTCLPLNLAERPAVYNIFAPTSNIYPPQIKIYILVLTR